MSSSSNGGGGGGAEDARERPSRSAESSLAGTTRLLAGRLGASLGNLDFAAARDATRDAAARAGESARERVQKMELGSKLESGKIIIRSEIQEKASKMDGSRVRAWSASLGDATRSAAERLGESVGSIDASQVRSGAAGLGERLGRSLADLGENLGGGMASLRAEAEIAEKQRQRIEYRHKVIEAHRQMREAEEACTRVIREHLEHYVSAHPEGTYEEWLRELHPENNYEGELLDGFSEIDHRFYVEGSDHRRIWNENLGGGLRREVPARCYGFEGKGGGGGGSVAPAVDLLDADAPSGDDSNPPPPPPSEGAGSGEASGGGEALGVGAGAVREEEQEEAAEAQNGGVGVAPAPDASTSAATVKTANSSAVGAPPATAAAAAAAVGGDGDGGDSPGSNDGPESADGDNAGGGNASEEPTPTSPDETASALEPTAARGDDGPPGGEGAVGVGVGGGADGEPPRPGSAPPPPADAPATAAAAAGAGGAPTEAATPEGADHPGGAPPGDYDDDVDFQI